ncbi:MAG: ester cyclase [Arenicellaceae bacterium]|nr:ester cyclase [Arenicellaceae bacterium]
MITIRGFGSKRVGKLLAIAGFSLGFSLSSLAATAEIEANKMAVTRLIHAMGIPAEFSGVALEVFAENDKQLRNEFENLVYNAKDPVLSELALPPYEAITNRTNTITRILGEGNMVAASIRVQGTHSGNLYGIPATGKTFDIESAAVFKLANRRIVEAWYMADEATLLRQLDVRLPVRQDGLINLPPGRGDVGTFDDALAEHMTNPVDTPEYRHSKLLLAYKSENKPVGYNFPDRPYSKLLRSSMEKINKRGAELGFEGNHNASMSGKHELLGNFMSEGDLAMFKFRLSAVNSSLLYSVSASGNTLNNWKLGFAEFDGDSWTNAWFMADELGFLLAIGNQEATEFLVGDIGKIYP